MGMKYFAGRPKKAELIMIIITFYLTKFRKHGRRRLIDETIGNGQVA
jgi:hypothetical protein